MMSMNFSVALGMFFHRYLRLFAVLVGFGVGQVASTESPEIIRESGVSNGFAVVVGTTDGMLEAELAGTGKFLVQGLALCDETARKARDGLFGKGLYGQATIYPVGSIARLPYADYFVNLLVVAEASLAQDEALRVLAPGGVALFLTRHKNAVDRKLVRPWPQSFDQWSHSQHSPDGNRVSHDTAVGPPKRIQWTADPLWSRTHDSYASVSAMVTDGGRIFYVLDDGPAGVVDARFSNRWTLYARDAFNGVLLWRLPMDDWFKVIYSTQEIEKIKGPWRQNMNERLVAAAGKVFIKPGAKSPVTALDAATGQKLRAFAGTEFCREFAVHRGVLAAGKHMYDIETGQKLWEKDGEGVMDADSIFLVKKQGSLESFDLRTGKRRWVVSEQDIKTFRAPLAAEGRIYMFGRDETITVAQDSGKILWRKPIPSKPFGTMSFEPGPYVIGGRLWTESGVHYEAASGEDRRTFTFEVTSGHHIRCYGPKATPRFLLTGKRGIEFHEIASGVSERCDWVRPTCGIGFVPSNGLLYVPPHPCFCYIGSLLHGFYALAPGPNAGTNPAPPTERWFSSQTQATMKPVQPGATWPTYRSDGQRSGSTTARVPVNLAVTWRTKLNGRLSAPVMADEKVYLSLQDSATVVCLDAINGKELWRFGCGGRVDSPPTIHGTLALFGCTDGWVYAVRADNGTEAWRFRVAPEERLVGGYGRVESAWPVKGTILVQNAKAYAVAGRSSYLDAGIVLVALDPLTGRFLHETRVAHATSDIPVKSKILNSGFALEGALAEIPIGDGRCVYLRQHEFDGALAKLPVKRLTSNGDTEVGLHLMATSDLLDDSGFNRTFWTFSRRWPGYYFGTNAPKCGQMLVFNNSMTYGVKAHAGKQGRHSSIFIPEQQGWLLFADDNANEATLDPASKNSDKGKPGLTRQVPAKWTAWTKILVRAMVLTGVGSDKQIVFVCGAPDVVPKDDPLAAYEGRAGAILQAVSAIDGSMSTKLQLDAPPVWDGMIAVEGRLYISLADGSIVCLGEAKER